MSDLYAFADLERGDFVHVKMKDGRELSGTITCVLEASELPGDNYSQAVLEVRGQENDFILEDGPDAMEKHQVASLVLA